MEFEIMEAGWRPSRRRGIRSGTFSVGIRPRVVSGRKAAAWVRISGGVSDEARVDREAAGICQLLNWEHCREPLLPARAPTGIRYIITKSGKAGGLRRAT